MSDVADFIGRGISFPLRVDQSGGIALAEGGDGIDASIRMALSTAPGERVMRPQFGCRIWDLLFEPVNANTLGLMAEAVRDALSQWEPRIEVDDVEVTASADRSVLYIDVRYSIRGTNNPRSLVFPFYVIPSHDEPDGPGAAGPAEESER
jgi:phage baseplate assembly protein W